MELSGSNLIQIAGIAIASIIGIIGLTKYSSNKKNANNAKVIVDQKSGALSSGKQNSQININNNND
ncbi:hypothetical protein [Pseudoteredinibacter isoporae]|uniref:Uncharacterized protein n=1 Tax=Pseudoteredinibacter isoporae TaxID=570281 RepID=A0A7X0MV97_9GAMM|nr:hypothetical protein [Pseudoteredinibacter isoporae]MBB6521148.1 hypothetical protein [Pseudoteredinibacter isoporae]NHO86708.1 hypothetical protein [Pseudoteredinibacter isoporae]NIB24840.1 hypothetical protein [Pseudoteredinibacter isoporae]